MYMFPDRQARQALKYLLVAIHLHTVIMSKPIGLLVPFDADMGLDLDDPNVLTLPQALSHGLHSGFWDATVWTLAASLGTSDACLAYTLHIDCRWL